MNIDETTLIEIQDYINALDEKVGLKPETMADVRNAISKHKYELKNLRLGIVVLSEERAECEQLDLAEMEHTAGQIAEVCGNCGRLENEH